MAIITLEEHIIVAEYRSDLPDAPIQGMPAFAYAKDTMRHYMFSNGAWYDLAAKIELGKSYTATGLENNSFTMRRTGVTNASGVARIYLTDNGLSTGNAVYTTLTNDELYPIPVGNASNYQVTGTTLSGDKKYVDVTVNQLGAVLLGLVQVTAAAAGVTVRCLAVGK